MGEVEAGGSWGLLAHTCTVLYIILVSCVLLSSLRNGLWKLNFVSISISIPNMFVLASSKAHCLGVGYAPISGKNGISPRVKPLCLWAELASQLFPADVPMLGPWYKSAWSGKEKPKVQPWEAQSREETPLGTIADCLPLLSWLVLTGVNACCDLWFCLLLPVLPWGDSEDTHPGLFPLRMSIALKGLFRWISAGGWIYDLIILPPNYLLLTYSFILTC